MMHFSVALWKWKKNCVERWRCVYLRWSRMCRSAAACRDEWFVGSVDAAAPRRSAPARPDRIYARDARAKLYGDPVPTAPVRRFFLLFFLFLFALLSVSVLVLILVLLLLLLLILTLVALSCLASLTAFPFGFEIRICFNSTSTHLHKVYYNHTTTAKLFFPKFFTFEC